MRKTMVMFGACVLALSGVAAAQTGAAHPGYFAIEDMGVLAKDDLEVDVNVEGDPRALAAYAKEDQGFHEYIMEIAGGEVFSRVFKAYAIVTFTYHADLPGGFVRHPRETIQEHLDMIEAICNRDGDKAEALVRRHMRLGSEKFIKELEKEEQMKT